MKSLIEELPGDGEPIARARSEIIRAAGTELPVLLVGESGTGKDLVGRLIHDLGSRRERPFVSANLATIPQGLASSEIIGYAKGAFTGATRDRLGFFQHADGGTLFLDEIALASIEIQNILLSILGSGSIRRLGEAMTRSVNVRLISATNQDMQTLIESGEFRAELYFRLSVIVIRLPPLRERKTDIPLLAENVLAKVSGQLGRRLVLAPKAVEALQGYDFPGNFRELRNVLQRAALIAPGQTIGAKELRLPTIARRQRVPTQGTPRLEAAHRQIEGLQRDLDALRATTIKAQPIWQGRSFRTQHDYCFVLMPFGDNRDMQTVYRDHIKVTIERCGLRCHRADDIYDVSGVMQSVWEGINRTRVVVADLTERNPNVFYELGIAHTLGKPVIMLSQSIDFVPFDLRHLRCIVYTYTPRGAAQLEQALERTIKTVLSSGIDMTAGNDERAKL